MSDALHHRLEEIKNHLLGKDEVECAPEHEDAAWQIVVIDLANSTLRLLKEIEEPHYAF